MRIWHAIPYWQDMYPAPKPSVPPEQASDDVTVPHPPDNTGSSAHDPDNERPGGMSGGLGGDGPSEEQEPAGAAPKDPAGS